MRLFLRDLHFCLTLFNHNYNGSIFHHFFPHYFIWGLFVQWEDFILCKFLSPHERKIMHFLPFHRKLKSFLSKKINSFYSFFSSKCTAPNNGTMRCTHRACLYNVANEEIPQKWFPNGVGLDSSFLFREEKMWVIIHFLYWKLSTSNEGETCTEESHSSL